ncbi:MAG: urea transporter [Bacteroidales bacterium]
MKLSIDIKHYRYLGDGFLNSYSQVFFSDHPVFALLIILITFIVPASGIAGIAGVCISILLAVWLGLDRILISKGIFSYNTLLVTLPLGLFFQPGFPLILLVVLAAILTFFLTVVFRSAFLKSNLPFLSWPFLISLWIIMLAVRQFSSIEVGDQSLFIWNRLYEVGGIPLVHGVEWLNRLYIPQSLKTYLISLGAIFFQYNLIAGFVIAFGLMISSRIAFLLSLTGFFTAYIFYALIGLDINTLNYTYIGFNYILTAIAIGGFFMIPSVFTFLWTIILIPVVALLTVSMEELLAGSTLSIYALPFNLVVPVFLYALQQRKSTPAGLQPVIIQHNSPEKNLYAWSNFHNRLSRRAWVLFRLPFLGKWTVSQGHNGKHTHQSDWRFAWDFVKMGPDDRTYSGPGTELTDYLCYGKPVYPAGNGVVDSVVDGVPDNKPGDANTTQNWGNTVVIMHAPGLYTKYSHLKPGSIRIKTGEYVLTHTELAQTGNSGRSPEPHLHFQFQVEPNIDAATLDYPFGYYLCEKDGLNSLKSYDRPAEHDHIANLIPDGLMKKALHFVPGQKIRVNRAGGKDGLISESLWEVHTDYYNNSYIYDRQTHATAWFVNDDQLFYFTHYEGSSNNPLFSFFQSCFRVPLVFDPKITLADQLPLSVSTKRRMLWLQDWIAPFYLFLQSEFSLTFREADDSLNPSVYRLHSGINRKVFHKTFDISEFNIQIFRGDGIKIESDGSTLELTKLNS